MLRERIALTLPPLIIRLTLAATFIWAGVGKFQDVEVSGQQAADLANLGIKPVIAAAVGAPSGIPAVPPGATTTPEEATAEGDESPAAEPTEEPTPPVEDLTEEPPAGDDTPVDEPPADEPPAEEPPADPEDDPGPSIGLTSTTPTIVRVQNAQPTAPANPKLLYTAEQFPQPVTVKRMFVSVAPRLHTMGVPALTEGSWPTYLAWAAALTELIGGLLLIPGAFARIWGLGLCTAMGVALWSTTIHPNLGGDTAFLGFWPDLNAAYGTSAWAQLTTGFWQLALFVMAFSIFLGGAGRLSVDHLLFGPARADVPRKAAKGGKK